MSPPAAFTTMHYASIRRFPNSRFRKIHRFCYNSQLRKLTARIVCGSQPKATISIAVRACLLPSRDKRLAGLRHPEKWKKNSSIVVVRRRWQDAGSIVSNLSNAGKTRPPSLQPGRSVRGGDASGVQHACTIVRCDFPATSGFNRGSSDLPDDGSVASTKRAEKVLCRRLCTQRGPRMRLRGIRQAQLYHA